MKKEQGVRVLEKIELKELIDRSEGCVLIEFYSTASGASHIMSPLFEELASKYGARIGFYRVNLELIPEVSASFSIRRVPSYLFVKDGTIVDRVEGVTPKSELEQKLIDRI